MITSLIQTKFEQIIALGIVFLVFVFFILGYGIVQAEAAVLEVDFEATPLFLNANVVPGDSTTRTVTVENTEATNELIFVSVENTFDTGLASVMELEISDGTTTHYSGSFLDFFASTPLPLGSIDGGMTTVYNFTASLPNTTGNPYQNKQLGFDLVIGWDGGSATDTTTSRSGGGGRREDILSIFNETIAALDIINNAVSITWNTNLPATSYLICGDVTEAPITLQTEPPLFGYQFVLPEIDTQTVAHEMEVTNLAARTYECRPASRTATSEPFTVGAPLSFTIPSGQVAGESISVLDSPDLAELILAVQDAYNNHSGSVLGVSTGGKGTFGGPTYEEWLAELQEEQDRREHANTNNSSSTMTEEVRTTHESQANLPGQEQPEPFPIHNLFWLLIFGVISFILWYWYRKQ